MISQNEKMSKLKGLLTQGKLDSVVSLLRDDTFKAGLNQNNPEFMYFMYKLYANKAYKHYSEEKARDMLNKSISLKHPEACSEKGRNLLFGIGCSIDIAKAEDSFRQSLDCEQSRYYIAEIYLKGMATDDKGKSFYDFDEAKEQLKEVVALNGKFYKDALLKLAVIILKQSTITAEDEAVISVSIATAAQEDSVEGHEAKVLLGKFFLRQLKATLGSILKAPVINAEKHFDLQLLTSESSGLLHGVEGNLERLSLMPDTI